MSGKFYTNYATCDGRDIYKLCLSFLKKYWLGEGAYQVQITALDPMLRNQQLRLFDGINENRMDLYKAVDEVNQRYGNFSLSPARLMHRSKMPNVIAPAWKPFGHRQTI